MRETSQYEEFRYTCTGSIGKGKEAINCYGHEVHGTIGLKKAFSESCNAAFAQIGAGLNASDWNSLCNSLYYNKTLPIKELEQKSSRFDAASVEAKGDIMQAAIGQGTVLTTPLQNSFLVSAVLNEGKLMKPYLVDRIENTYGNVVRQQEPSEVAAPITKKEAKVLKEYMREAVLSGTATALNTSRYKAGGKTGSAQFKEGSTDSHAWFVGYAEKEGRQLVVSIIVEGAGTGSAHAVPIARKIFDAYF
jgi:peptidoglycan glycosyltransferase